MKKIIYIALGLLLVSLVSAEYNNNITTIQGIAEYTNGTRLDGSYVINVSIVNSDSSIAWSENQTRTITNGRFFVNPGTITALTWHNFWNGMNYSIEINGEQFVQTPITKVPLAFIADFARATNWTLINNRPTALSDFTNDINLVNTTDLENLNTSVKEQITASNDSIKAHYQGSRNISLANGVISINISCEDFTGSADLCDGDDAVGGGGAGIWQDDGSWVSPNSSYAGTVNASTITSNFDLNMTSTGIKSSGTINATGFYDDGVLLADTNETDRVDDILTNGFPNNYTALQGEISDANQSIIDYYKGSNNITIGSDGSISINDSFTDTDTNCTVDNSCEPILYESELDDESELEAQLTDVTNVYTDNDNSTIATIKINNATHADTCSATIIDYIEETELDSESELETQLTDVTNVYTADTDNSTIATIKVNNATHADTCSVATTYTETDPTAVKNSTDFNGVIGNFTGLRINNTEVCTGDNGLCNQSFTDTNTNCSGNNCDIGWGNLTSVPADIADGDDDTTYTADDIWLYVSSEVFYFNESRLLLSFYNTTQIDANFSLYDKTTTINTKLTNLNTSVKAQITAANTSVKSYMWAQNFYNSGDNISSFIVSNVTAANTSMRSWVLAQAYYMSGDNISSFIVSNVTAANTSMKTYVDATFSTYNCNSTNCYSALFNSTVWNITTNNGTFYTKTEIDTNFSNFYVKADVYTNHSSEGYLKNDTAINVTNVISSGVATMESNLTITDGTTTYVWYIDGTSLLLRKK